MSRPWFRMYAEFVTDPKVQLLAFDDQRHYIMLLCLKCNDTLDSNTPSPEYRERMIAKSLGLDPSSASEAKRRLVEVGLISTEWQPLKWDSRQYESDSSAARTRAWRKRNKEETSQDGHGDVTVTDENRTEQIQNSVRAAKPPPTDGTDADQIWSLGVQILGESSRSLLGRKVKQYGREIVAAKIGELSAMAPRPVDPKSWLAGCLKPREKRAGRFKTA